MTRADRRYLAIKPLFRQGEIKSLTDIFEFVPKSVIIEDLGKNNGRFNNALNNLGEFGLKDLFLIGSRCDLSRVDMLYLVIGEIELRQQQKEPSDNAVVDAEKLKDLIKFNDLEKFALKDLFFIGTVYGLSRIDMLKRVISEIQLRESEEKSHPNEST